MKRDPNKYERASQERIKYLINTKCNGSQQEFADRVGIGKSSVSQYVKGTNFPSNIRAGQIAEAFGVNPAWVMGFDGPMVDDLVEPTEANYYLDPEVAEMVQDLHDNHNLRIIFDATRKASKEDIQFIIDMLDRMGLND